MLVILIEIADVKKIEPTLLTEIEVNADYMCGDPLCLPKRFRVTD